MTFPLLFPFGLPKIPGATFRKKAKLLLASHPYYRCGRLQCHLTLFLYHIIQDYAMNFARTQLSVQSLNVPDGTNRNIDSPIFANDPSSPSYWRARQSEVRALCREYGDPDLMITFTFVNHWPEVQVIKDSLHETFGFPLDLRFCPTEEMMIWRSRFLDIKSDDFSPLITALGFGHPTHFSWRLEFQARGAPHVHALVWLQSPLSIETLTGKMFAVMPNEKFPQLRHLVTHNMIHSCNVWRCKRGDPNASCRYGFPKSPCESIHVTDEGALALHREVGDRWVVEFSPSFLLKWRGHCHIHVLKTADHPYASPNAIHYIVKYNFKEEPSLRVEIGAADTYDTLFRARVISSEEAAARIFSLHFFGSDAAFDYLPIQPPESRKAAFVAGVQVQIPVIERYFHRPLPLDQLPIAAFLSLYDITAAKESHRQRRDRDERAPLSQPPVRQRPPGTLANGDWERCHLAELDLIPSAPLIPSTSLPDARALNCSLRARPKIILTEKFLFNTDPDTFSYAYLLLHGCWRSDSEIRAACPSWLSALFFHGLILPSIPEITGFQHRLIDYMLDSCRYSPYEIACTISRLSPNARVYLHERARTAPRLLQPLLNQVLQALPAPDWIPPALSLNRPDIAPAAPYISCDFSPSAQSAARTVLEQQVPRLNVDQRSVYSHVEGALDANSVFTLFVNGRAGTGKSFLISCLRALFTVRATTFITCASTGIAASLIDGRTVHSAFGLYTTSTGETRCSLDIGNPRGYAVAMCRVIIIDEITMISRSVLNALDSALRRLSAQVDARSVDQCFGGKSVLFFGDLAQVPAVVRAHNDDFAESAEQFFESLPYHAFSQFTLHTVMRQDPNQEQFMALLSDVRTNTHLSDETLSLLRSRFHPHQMEAALHFVDEFVGYDDPGGMVITFRNERANYYNDLILADRAAKSQTSPTTLQAKFLVRNTPSFAAHLPPNSANFDTAAEMLRPSLATDAQIRLLFAAFRRRQFNTIIPLKLSVIPGARVMLLQNIDTAAGLINGARGTIVSYLEDCDTLSVSFDNQPQGAAPILITRTASVSLPLAGGTEIFLYQFPLKLCWAVTAHKSQGQSLRRVAIDIAEPAFAHGALYVALSRVRSLESLLLFGLDTFPAEGPLFHINPFIREHEAAQSINDV